MTLSFHRLAERELNDAAYYYDRQNPGLGAAFLDEVERICADIAAFPHAGATLHGAIRRRMVRRFPYALLYTVQTDTIRILAVMNLRRRPTYWFGRS